MHICRDQDLPSVLWLFYELSSAIPCGVLFFHDIGYIYTEMSCFFERTKRICIYLGYIEHSFVCVLCDSTLQICYGVFIY